MVQLVEHPTLDFISGHDFTVHEIKPHAGLLLVCTPSQSKHFLKIREVNNQKCASHHPSKKTPAQSDVSKMADQEDPSSYLPHKNTNTK